jgi:hypothetical protein
MKVTVQINGIDTEIELTAEQVASIKAQEKFEFVYSRGSSYYLNATSIVTSSNGADPIVLYHGRYRKTKKAAEQSLERNRRANRIEALAEQLGGLQEFNYITEMYYVYKQFGRWGTQSLSTTFCPEVIYMTKECAETIADMLNSGEFEL